MFVETCLHAKFYGFLGRIRSLNLVRMCEVNDVFVLVILYAVGECYYRHSFVGLRIESLSTCTASWIMMKFTCIGI